MTIERDIIRKFRNESIKEDKQLQLDLPDVEFEEVCDLISEGLQYLIDMHDNIVNAHDFEGQFNRIKNSKQLKKRFKDAVDLLGIIEQRLRRKNTYSEYCGKVDRFFDKTFNRRFPRFKNEPIKEDYEDDDYEDTSEEMHKERYVIYFETPEGKQKYTIYHVYTDSTDDSYNELCDKRDNQLGMYNSYKELKDALKERAEKIAAKQGWTVKSIDNLGEDEEYYRERNKYESAQKSEAKLDKTHIDFDHIGFGLSVKAGYEGKYYTVYLEGYSNNTEKDLEFLSDILINPKTDAEDVENERKIREIRKAIASEISELANEFDAKVLEIVKKHGLKSKKEN